MPGKDPSLLIIGCDWHTRCQEIARLGTATGEVVSSLELNPSEDSSRGTSGWGPSANKVLS
jgi:hypothetical protein